MKLDKALRRDNKLNRRRHGMKRDGDSVKIIQKEQEKRKDTIKKKNRDQKEDLLDLVEDD